jgi:hypothetical protein
MMRSLIICGALIFIGASEAAMAQSQQPGPSRVVFIPRVRWAWHNPYDTITSRIYAQADLVRASGESAVYLAEARKLHAEAVDKEIDNWMKAVRAYWDIKITREEELVKLERQKQYRLDLRLDKQKITNSRTWDRLKNHPELTGSSIAEGAALNFLLARLSTSTDSLEAAEGNDLKLTAEQLHAIQLRQPGRGGEQLQFRADSEGDLKLDWWPYLLRTTQYEALRRQFETDRDNVLAQAKAARTIPAESLENLQKSLMELTRQFYKQASPDQWAQQGYQKYAQYKAAEAFLRRLDREVLRLQNSGDASVLAAAQGYDPKRHGATLASLLVYMITSGLEFAPATPGDEPAYHTVFATMRDVYVAIADSDEGSKRSDRF